MIVIWDDNTTIVEFPYCSTYTVFDTEML